MRRRGYAVDPEAIGAARDGGRERDGVGGHAGGAEALRQGSRSRDAGAAPEDLCHHTG
jgi:hypothetical protein